MADDGQWSGFEHDVDRILYSTRLRALADKSQVVASGELGAYHTRLTHSMKVAQLGRRMAELHFTGGVLDSFEGNAQTLHILTFLAAHKYAGHRRLHLTRACLDAATKYPWERAPRDVDPARHAKWGVYAVDRQAFAWVRAGRSDDVVPIRSPAAVGPSRRASSRTRSLHESHRLPQSETRGPGQSLMPARRRRSTPTGSWQASSAAPAYPARPPGGRHAARTRGERPPGAPPALASAAPR